ncbi:MAG: hypothetical protein M4D80_01175 [Myxococcota bacterium]|nr:hypothetical protein [Myxococcota bacterium]
MRVVLLLVCACGRIAFDPVGQLALDDSGAEGMMPGDGSGMTGCIEPGAGTTFPGGPACSTWGGNVTMINASVSEASGTLSITPNPNTAGAQGTCLKNNAAFGAGGAIVEVSAILDGNSLTGIQLGGGATALSMVAQNGTLLAQDASGTKGMVAYNAATTRFWRIRPQSGVVFEYGDGTTWTQLGTSTQMPQATYNVTLIAGEITAVAMPGTARFESVNLCPP